MITRIEIENFKSLQKVDLALGNLNLFVGTNASGKSNFFDALRFLQGVGYGFTIDEILNGKPKSAGSEVWQAIRGGSARVGFASRQATDGVQDPVVAFTVHMTIAGRKYRYSIGIAPGNGSVRNESLSVDEKSIFDSSQVTNESGSPVLTVRYYPGQRGRQPHLDFQKSRPVLHQLIGHDDCVKTHREQISNFIMAMSNTQRIDPSPAILREYSQAQAVKRMGERGENFAALVKTIVGDPKDHEAYVSWLKQLTPVELDDVSVLAGALSEPLFAIREAGVDRPAPILSDGTLRFAAIAAAFFQKDMPDILTIEEIENGIHPSRLRLLVELLRSQSTTGDRQIMATTHSPIVLAWLESEDYRHTFFCKRDEQTGASVITALDQIPNFMDLVKKHPIGDLFAEGWLEGAL